MMKGLSRFRNRRSFIERKGVCCEVRFTSNERR